MHHSYSHHKGFIPTSKLRVNLILALFAALYLSTALTANSQTPSQPNLALMKYACGPANRMFATLSPASRFTDTTAGFDLLPSPTIEGNSCTSDKPFFFSVPIPEGSYRVTVVLGGPQAAVRTLDLVGTDSGDSLPHEMSYLTVTKLQYAVTPAQESGFSGCAFILRFPQQCPFWPFEAASVWQCGYVDRPRRRT